MEDKFQPCEVIESNLLDPTKPTDLKTEFAEVRHLDFSINPLNKTVYDIVKKFNIKATDLPFIYKP